MTLLSCRLKTVSLVVRHSQSAEALVKAYESKLYEEDAMNSEVRSIETVISTLKVRHCVASQHTLAASFNVILSNSQHSFLLVTAMADRDR